MADKKISQLTNASTPLAGTEVLPIVQAGSTDQVSVADLTAGRTVSMSGATVTGLTASKGVFTDASKNLTSTGTLAVAQGGTAKTSWTANGLVYADTTTSLTNTTALTFASSKLSVNDPNGKFEVLSGATNATGNALYVNNDSKTTGTLARFYTNNGNPTNSGNLVEIINDFNAGATADLLYLQQDDDGAGINILMSRGGVGIKVNASGGGDAAQFTAGNIKFLTAAKGINFTANTPAAGKTSQLLNWYEEGTWTPSYDSSTPGTGRATTTVSARYTRIGRTVTVEMAAYLSTLGTGGSGDWVINGLPFTPAVYAAGSVGRAVGLLASLNTIGVVVTPGAGFLQITGSTAAGTSPLAAISFGTYVQVNTNLWLTITYTV